MMDVQLYELLGELEMSVVIVAECSYSGDESLGLLLL